MIDASSRLQHNSLCIPNSPERHCRSQMSKYTMISLSLTIKLFCLANLDQDAQTVVSKFLSIYLSAIEKERNNNNDDMSRSSLKLLR